MRFGKDGLVCSRVTDAEGLAACARLVNGVYTSRLQLPVRSSDLDMLGPQHSVFLVRSAQGEPLGTGLWQSPGFKPEAAPLPLELEHNYDLASLLSALGVARGAVAEVRRLAVPANHSDVLRLLLSTAIEASEQAGISHWVGLVEATGSVPSDVALVHRVLEAHGLEMPGLPLKPLEHLELWHERGRSAYTAEQLKRLPVPRKVRSFAAALAARAVSVPSMHPHYDDRVTVPMTAQVSTFRNQWLPQGGL